MICNLKTLLSGLVFSLINAHPHLLSILFVETLIIIKQKHIVASKCYLMCCKGSLKQSMLKNHMISQMKSWISKKNPLQVQLKREEKKRLFISFKEWNLSMIKWDIFYNIFVINILKLISKELIRNYHKLYRKWILITGLTMNSIF